MIRFLLAFLLFAQTANAAERVVADMSQSLVSITANFDGTAILIFGAVKRNSPAPKGKLEVIIAVTGPSSPVIVRKKSRVLGIWVNREAVKIDFAPSFYAVASTNPLPQVLSQVEDFQRRVSIERMIRSAETAKDTQKIEKFAQAIVRIRDANGLYTETGGKVKLTEGTLFKTEIALPSNLVEGDYLTRIFLTRDKKVVDEYQTTIAVRKVGLERWIYNLAHERPLAYGILSLVIAIFAGWLASAIFRVLRLN